MYPSTSRPILPLLLLLASTQACLSQSSAAPSRGNQVQPIITKERLFSIPYFLNPNTQQPSEVHLYVSGDKGANWFHYQKRLPDQRKFDFQAGKDGSYWFVVRTSQDANKPTASTRPEKIVIVDQSKPQLELTMQIGPAGEIVAIWKADDATLDASTFRLSYRSSISQPWQPVVVQRPSPTSIQDEVTFHGRETWTVGTDVQEVEAKAEVRDRAGNSSSTRQKLSLLGGSGSVSQQRLGPLPPPRALSDSAPTPQVTTSSTPWTTKRDPVSAYDGGWESRGFGGIASSGAAPELPPATTDAIPSMPTDFGPSIDSAGPPTKQEYEPPVANQLATESPSSHSNQTMTQSVRFNLDYEMTGVGGFGAHRVELWVTEDDGQSWRPFGVDVDRTSPFEVDTGREGSFGFRLLIHDEAGNAARPPQPGEAPDLAVVVDTTPPKVLVVSADFSRTQPNAIVIKWDAADSYLKDRPVQISFAPRPDGPWSIIETDLPNDGLYNWAPQHRLPGKVYLRVEATDRAGNVGMDETVQPVGAAKGGPRGIIRQIRPIQ